LEDSEESLIVSPLYITTGLPARRAWAISRQARDDNSCMFLSEGRVLCHLLGGGKYRSIPRKLPNYTHTHTRKS